MEACCTDGLLAMCEWERGPTPRERAVIELFLAAERIQHSNRCRCGCRNMDMGYPAVNGRRSPRAIRGCCEMHDYFGYVSDLLQADDDAGKTGPDHIINVPAPAGGRTALMAVVDRMRICRSSPTVEELARLAVTERRISALNVEHLRAAVAEGDAAGAVDCAARILQCFCHRLMAHRRVTEFSGLERLFQLFLDHPQLDLNVGDDYGHTVLYMAIELADADIIQRLIRRGADLRHAVPACKAWRTGGSLQKSGPGDTPLGYLDRRVEALRTPPGGDRIALGWNYTRWPIPKSDLEKADKLVAIRPLLVPHVTLVKGAHSGPSSGGGGGGGGSC